MQSEMNRDHKLKSLVIIIRVGKWAIFVLNRVRCLRPQSCLVPRRLSFDENVRAKEGGKETTACCLYPSHGPLRFITSHSFRARLCHAKNEAPEEEAVHKGYQVFVLVHGSSFHQ